jgi:hypothetical protein
MNHKVRSLYKEKRFLIPLLLACQRAQRVLCGLVQRRGCGFDSRRGQDSCHFSKASRPGVGPTVRSVPRFILLPVYTRRCHRCLCTVCSGTPFIPYVSSWLDGPGFESRWEKYFYLFLSIHSGSAGESSHLYNEYRG